jgi:PAS domain S-box-containing protein
MQQSLAVLMVEDREHDAALLVRELRRSGYLLFCERVDSEPAMAAALSRQTWDIVLADYSLPQFNAVAALSLVARSGIDVPVIVVSGAVGEEAAVEVMQAGARDLILKHNLKRLPPAVARELEAAKGRRERRDSDAKLDNERRLLQQLMQGLPEAICFKDKERRYIRLNDAERANLGIPDDLEVIGRTSGAFMAGNMGQKRCAEEERVLATGEPLVDCIDEIVGPAGTVRWLSTTKAPIRGPSGEIVGLVEVARDITEGKRQEQLKDEFIATVSHELRTPLTSITGAIGLIVGHDAIVLPEKVTRMLTIALANCRRLAGIVDDILDIEKIESGKMTFDSKPVEVRTLVDQAVQANQAMATQHGVCVRLDEVSVECEVMADPDRLTQVITNLLSNAIKFSPPDMDVIAGVERLADRACIRIRDHGPGIPEDYKARVFEKFVQVEATDNRRRGGTGLGLSIAKQIVSHLDGEIGFEAAPGGGTIFTVLLRACERGPIRRQEPQPVASE